MKLTGSVVEELKNLKEYYEMHERLFDIDFVASYFDIINSTDVFRNKVDIEVIDDEYFVADEEKGLITFSLKGVEREAMKVLSIFTELYTSETEYLIKNYFALLTLLHETSHVAQTFCLDEDDVVNEYYYLLLKRRIFSWLYSNLGDFLSYERHANIDVHSVLIDVYDDSDLAVISKTYYLNLITYLYGKLSPTEKTQAMFLMPKYFNTKNLSNMKKIEVGFPVDKEIIRLIDNELIREARGEIDFYECKKRIVGITNGIKR